MAEMKSVSEHSRITDWLDNSKKAAKQLLVKADEISDRTFKSGDLSIFFSLLSRFSYFDYRNLLLLSAQYPQATDLAGFNTWKNMLPKDAMILKKESQGKGISLLAPFTEDQGSTPCLIWFTVKMYDISQTTIPVKNTEASPYIQDKVQHINTLLKAIRNFLAKEFNVEFVFADTDTHIITGLACYSKGNKIYIKPKATELQQLSYLIEHLVQTNTNSYLSDNILIYLANNIRDCLFRIWNLPKQMSFSPPYEEIVKLSIESQNTFLSLAQQWVRYIEDVVLYEYLALKNNDSELFVSDDELFDSYLKYS